MKTHRLFPLGVLLALLFQPTSTAWTRDGIRKKPNERFRVDPRRVRELNLETPAGTYAELSAYLYGGDPSYAPLLMKLNHASAETREPGAKEKYALPKVRAKKGDTLQRFGAYWAGGSARSYLQLLPLNPRIRDSDELFAGQWIYVPRVPTPDEKAAWRAEYRHANGFDRNDRPPVARNDRPPVARIDRPAKARSAPPPIREKAAATPFAPVSSQERLALVEWYLEHLDARKDRARLDPMIDSLLAESPSDWKTHYEAGRYYLETDRSPAALRQFELSLRDPEAPIQVALLYVKTAEKEKNPISGQRRDEIFRRFPPLQNLLEAKADEP